LCLGPGPPSLLHLTRANAEKPYAGDTADHLSAERECPYRRIRARVKSLGVGGGGGGGRKGGGVNQV